MDLRHLRYFLAVAEEGHFGRAAERLHIVQPALSMQIKALEKELGGPLFIRSSRRVELTEAGNLLRAEALRTLDQAEHTRLTVQRAIRGETGRVRVGFAGNAVFSGKLMKDLRAFHKTYPDAELVLQEMAPQLHADAILAGQLDVGYTPDFGQRLDSALMSEPAGTWNMMLAMTEDHPLTTKNHLTIAMLANQPLIFYSASNSEDRLISVLQRLLGHELHVAYQTSSTLSVLALAAAGLGLALVPVPLMQVAIPGLVYKELDVPELSARLVTISRSEETSGAVLAFLALTRHAEEITY